MRTHLVQVFFLFSLLFTRFSCESPTQAKRFPVILVQDQIRNQYVPVKMSQLKIHVQVVANLATTTWEMQFFNDSEQVLEGQFYFPLGEGQTVSRFAMTVNNTLREGVVVEKDKGRQVFESISRRKIDPGLLEWTTGNSFKARIYPLLPKSYKTVIVAHEQELSAVEKDWQYTLPLNFQSAVDTFAISVEVLKPELRPELSVNHFENFRFEKWQDRYRAETRRLNYIPNQLVVFKIPQSPQLPKIIVEPDGEDKNKSYFYAYLTPEIIRQPKTLPRKIGILWDVSASGKGRNLTTEFELIKAYLQHIKNVEIELIPFSNTVLPTEKFLIRQGQCDQLEARLRSLVYDGGTQLGSLDLTKFNCDEFILGSDGISNFGESVITLAAAPIVVLNSHLMADHTHLNHLATKTGGVYLNLTTLSSTQALELLLSQPYTFVSAIFDSTQVTEIYPTGPTQVKKDFSIAGILLQEPAEITLRFGCVDSIKYSTILNLSHKDSLATHGLIKRIWAQKKINQLNVYDEQNQEQITALGKKHQIITRNTSLIVLDRLGDYVRHQIVPPPELQPAYFSRIKREQQQQENSQQKQLESVVTAFSLYQKWWQNPFENPLRRTGWLPELESSFDTDLETEILINDNRTSIDDRLTGIEEENLDLAELIRRPESDWIIKTEKKVSPRKAEKEAVAPEFEPVYEELIETPASRSARAQRDEEDQLPAERIIPLAENRTLTEITQPKPLASARHLSKTRRALRNFARFVRGENIEPVSDEDENNPIYLRELNEVENKDLYSVYLNLKQDYAHNVTFYLNLSALFHQRGLTELAVRILSNLAELELENHEQLRILGKRLLGMGCTQLAVTVFQRVQKMRAEEPQSYRDLGLAYAANSQYQVAVETLYQVVTGAWDDRFPQIQQTVLRDMNAIIANCPVPLDLSGIDPRLIKNNPIDLRLVLNWFSDNTDLDLWVSDSAGTSCYYARPQTNYGGQMLNDFRGGYGPEEFLLKKVPPGIYTIEVDFYESTQQRITGPTVLQVEVFTDFGRQTQQQQSIMLSLHPGKTVKVGNILASTDNQHVTFKITENRPKKRRTKIPFELFVPAIEIEDIELFDELFLDSLEPLMISDTLTRFLDTLDLLNLNDIELVDPLLNDRPQRLINEETIQKILHWMKKNPFQFSNIVKLQMNFKLADLTSKVQIRHNGKTYQLFLLGKPSLPEIAVLIVNYVEEISYFAPDIARLGEVGSLLKMQTLVSAGENPELVAFSDKKLTTSPADKKLVEDILTSWLNQVSL